MRLMPEENTFDVVDVGVDVSDEAFAKALGGHKLDTMGVSALLTATMPNMGRVINPLKARGASDNMKIIIGGASVKQQFAESIGEDGYAAQAGSAVDWARKALLTRRR